MQTNLKPQLHSDYSGLLSKLRDTYQKHYNLYMRSQLQRKQRCYFKEGTNVPVEPQNYYPCIEKIEMQLAKTSQKLLLSVNQLDEEDRECRETCKRTYDIVQKFNDCQSKCAQKFTKGLQAVYANHYESVLNGDPQYKKIKK